MTTTPAIVPASTTEARPAPGLWRTGAVSGAAAAAAATALAAVAHAAGVSLDTTQDEMIPLAGFAQITMLSVLVGLLIARTLAHRARHPRSTFTTTTVVLTALSCVPSVAMGGDVATQVTLVATHLVAAAIVIPAVRLRLPA